MMSRTVLAVAAVAVGVTAAVAQNVIADRKALMKRSGDEAKVAAAMVRGAEPFELAKAKHVFETYLDKANRLPTLFPENSKTGGETAAAPAIWEKPDEFKALVAKFGADAKAGLEQTKDLDSFKAANANILKDCGACHETFRLKM
jgi:cytochrome c556